jgi:DNA repair protein RecO (recombination protein O)
MKIDELSAWLLHQRPAKNTTSEVFFLTQERGLVRAFCAGAKRSKRAMLQPFTPLWLTLNERAYGAYVKQLEIATAPYFLTGDNLLSGLYLNELLYRALKPEMSDARLFDAYKNALNALCIATHQNLTEVALRRFESVLVEVSGYQVSYVSTANTQQAIIQDARYAFIPGEGFILDEQGFLGQHILAIGADKWDDVAVLKPAKLIMRRAIDHLLDGAIIKTRALYVGYSGVEEIKS